MIFKCKDCQKSSLTHKIDESDFRGHRCYNFQEVQEIPTGLGVGLNSGPQSTESIQQVYISMKQGANQQDIATLNNKRASPLGPSSVINKKLRTDTNGYALDTSNSAIGELIS